MFRELGDEYHTLLATYNLGVIVEDLGDLERARTLHEENLGRARALPSERIMAMSLGTMAMIAVTEGRAQDALSMLQESLRLNRDLGDRVGVAVDLRRFAAALSIDGKPEIAARLLSCAVALGEEIGLRLVWVIEGAEQRIVMIREQLGDAAFDGAWEQGRALTLDEAVALALDSVE